MIGFLKTRGLGNLLNGYICILGYYMGIPKAFSFYVLQNSHAIEFFEPLLKLKLIGPVLDC